MPVLPPPLLLLPPQAMAPLARVKRSANMPNMVRHLRRRAGMPKRRMQARAAVPVAYQRAPGRAGYSRAPVVAAVVVTVSVAVPAVVPVMPTGLVEPKLSVGGYWAPVGLDAMVADSATLPLKPPEGMMEMVELFPEVAPRVTVTAVPLMVKVGVAGVVTVTELVPDALKKIAELAASGV